MPKTPTGNMATASRAHRGAGGKKKLHRTTIEHHTNGGHTVRHEYKRDGDEPYMPARDEDSLAFSDTPSMVAHLGKKFAK